MAEHKSCAAAACAKSTTTFHCRRAWLRRVRAGAAALAAAVLLAGAPGGSALAQGYPDRPIRFILPFAPGGGTDIVGRIIAQRLSEQLGQQVVPDNRPGAGSHLGIDLAAKAKPDGYTIVLVAPEITTGPSLYKKLNYDPAKDFAPISMVAQTSYVMTVGPALQVASLKEFVDYAKANPGKVNYGSPGNGSGPHIAVELLKSVTGDRHRARALQGRGSSDDGPAGR